MEILKGFEIASNFLLGLMALIVTIVLGIITYYIQRRQTKLQNYHLKLGLFEKRYAYYKEIKSVFGELIDIDILNDLAMPKNLQKKLGDEFIFLFDNATINKLENIQSILKKEAKPENDQEKSYYMRERKKLSKELLRNIEDALTIGNLK